MSRRGPLLNSSGREIAHDLFDAAVRVGANHDRWLLEQRAVQRRGAVSRPVRIVASGYPKIERDRKGTPMEIWRGLDRRIAATAGYLTDVMIPSILYKGLAVPARSSIVYSGYRAGR
jgi:hypothetical protein